MKNRVLSLLGAVIPRRSKKIELGNAVDQNELRQLLDAQVRIIAGKVPAEVMAKVLSIRKTILGLLPASGTLSPGSPEWFLVERSATSYLPKSLESYLSLPRLYATRQRVQSGKTPKEILLDQLTLLESKLKEIAEDVHRNDADRLLAHGRFLEDRFGRSPLSLKPPISNKNETKPGP